MDLSEMGVAQLVEESYQTSHNFFIGHKSITEEGHENSHS